MIVMNGPPLKMFGAAVVKALWWASAEHPLEEAGWVALRWEQAGSESVSLVARLAEAVLEQGWVSWVAQLVLMLAVQSVQS